jgi:iron complex transport system substrate-binding protein
MKWTNNKKSFVTVMAVSAVVVTLVWLKQPSPKQPEKTTAPVSSESPTTRTITDMAGREVTIPINVKSVFSRCPMGTILTYTLNPDKMAGINWKPTTFERKYLNDRYQKLPVLGGWFATKEANVEEIIKIAPDILLFSAANPTKNQAVIDRANRVQETLGIPTVMFDSGLLKLPAIYRFAGMVLGESQRAEKLAAYVEDMLLEISKFVATIPENKKVRVYYAEGKNGLLTDPSGSLHSELIDFVGAINVADIKEIEGKGGMGRAQVSLEQLFAWDPEIILACHDKGFTAESSTYRNILKDPMFASLKAVKNKMLFEIPYKPFNVVDRPPSVNRVIGVKWMANLLYPELYPLDIRREFQIVYKLFYNISLNDEQLDEILEYAQRKPTGKKRS